jgi:hypothetical protein
MPCKSEIEAYNHAFCAIWLFARHSSTYLRGVLVAHIVPLMNRTVTLIGAVAALSLAVPVLPAGAATQPGTAASASKEVCKTSKTITVKGVKTRSSSNPKANAKVKFCAQVLGNNTIRLRGEMSFSTSGVSKKDRIRDAFSGATKYTMLVYNSGIRHKTNGERPLDSCSPPTGHSAFYMGFSDFWNREGARAGNVKVTYPMVINCSLGFGDPIQETNTTSVRSKGAYEAWFDLAWPHPSDWDKNNEQSLKVKFSIK